MGLFDWQTWWPEFLKRKDFYPAFSENYMIGYKGAIWLPVNQPFKMYDEIPQLNAVINRGADMFSNGEIMLVDESGKRIDNDKEFNQLFENPCAELSQNEWLATYWKQLKIWGNQYMYSPKHSTVQNYPTFMRPVSPENLKAYLSGLYIDQIEMSQMISKFEYYEQGKPIKTIETKDVVYSKISDVRFPVIGRSPILSLKFPVSNIDASYTNRNVIMNNRGSLGILSNNSKDAAGVIDIDPTQEKKLREEYHRRSNKKFIMGSQEADVIITKYNLKWQAMSYPTKELMLFEEVDANALTIMDHFGISSHLFSVKDATYENVQKGMEHTYQNTIQPAADSFAQKLQSHLQPKKGTIKISYDNTPVLKQAKRESLNSIEGIGNGLTTLVESKIITPQQALSILQNEIEINN